MGGVSLVIHKFCYLQKRVVRYVGSRVVHKLKDTKC